ncbi:hypothetical protein T069G_08771 [Trichoderma breve]|uniref:Uncharacterized protein n=1 Tax=Trichoderma breve TaxID=2034170 RepID=A0A9W9BAS3_9HYPO|nr:hypothetical protein T069G_08771 [Trichoderma breve]KAJ4857874.1 hypothetical protein T069G_08771 [Trichoderma breve]
MKTAGATILSLLAATGFAIPMEQAQQAGQAQMMEQAHMMEQAQMAVNGLFDPPRNGNGNIIGDIFDTAACILGSFVGSRTCRKGDPEVINITSDSHHNDNSSSSTSTSYQYSYTIDSDGDYHIEITPGGNKSNCTYTVAKEDAAVLATTISALATKCLNK